MADTPVAVIAVAEATVVDTDKDKKKERGALLFLCVLVKNYRLLRTYWTQTRMVISPGRMLMSWAESVKLKVIQLKP